MLPRVRAGIYARFQHMILHLFFMDDLTQAYTHPTDKMAAKSVDIFEEAVNI